MTPRFATRQIGGLPIFSPLLPRGSLRHPWHRAWVEHRRLNRLDRFALNDLGLSLADRASVTVEIIFERMRRGA